jgi:hypothetical protein
MASRILVAFGNDWKPCRHEFVSEPNLQVIIQPANIDLRFASAAVHCDRCRASRGERNALRMIELVARDVQRSVLTEHFQAIEREEIVILCGDERCKFGRAVFNTAAVRRQNQHCRSRPLHGTHSIVPAMQLLARKLSE